MPDREPTFAEIADALLEEVRHDAIVNELAEPFMAGLPQAAPGLSHSFAKLQRRMILVAEAYRIFAAMAPRETAHRELIGSL